MGPVNLRASAAIINVPVWLSEGGLVTKGPLTFHRLSGNCEDGTKKKHGPKWRYDGRGHDSTRTEEKEEEKYSSHNLI